MPASLGLIAHGSTSSVRSSWGPCPSAMDYFARLPSARTASPKWMSATYLFCTGPTAGITRSAPIRPYTPPFQEKNPRRPGVRIQGFWSRAGSRLSGSWVAGRGRPALHQQGSDRIPSETAPNPERNLHYGFERHWFPRSFRRHEFPAGQCTRGKGIQTFVRAVEDANVAHLAIRVNDRIKRDHAVHVGANQFQRIAGVRFFRGHRLQQFPFFPAPVEFRELYHPAARRGIQIRHVQRPPIDALTAKNLAVHVGDFIVRNRRGSARARTVAGPGLRLRKAGHFAWVVR